MAKKTARRAVKKSAIDPDLESIATAKRRLRNIDRSYKEIGRMVRAVTSKRARLDVELRQFANSTLDRLDREAREPFNAAPTNH